MSQAPAPAVTDVLEDVRKFLEGLKTDLPEVFRPKIKQKQVPSPALPAVVSTSPVGSGETTFPPRGKSREAGMEGLVVPFQGGKIHLEFVEGGLRSGVAEEDGGIVLRVADDESTVPTEFLREWYLKKAWEALRASVERWSAAMGLKPGAIRVKDQKTLWGSCSRDGNLCFNWRLILAPPPMLDYVVIHELAHLREMNHSKAFWAAVAAWCPDHQERRDWLRDHDSDLRWDPRSVELV